MSSTADKMKELFDAYRTKTGWQGLDAESAIESFLNFCEGELLNERTVLAREGKDALVFTGIRSPEPFVVAHGYDEATNSWRYGSYYQDLGQAWDKFQPTIIEEATIRWQREDFEEALARRGIAATAANVDALIEEMQNMAGWRDLAIQDGNERIEECVSYAALPDKPAKQEQPTLADRQAATKQQVSQDDANGISQPSKSSGIHTREF